MAQATAEVFEFPAGGIADFYMEDHEIEALEREEAAQEFGSSGIATFEPIATRMASYGRYGDDTVAHVETGELIVPKALIDDNPKLRDSIFSHLRDLGVEDPERYVVGSGVNSINPDTGMPEFFLKKLFKGVKKGVSKLAKGVSKALKGVTKVIKKAAPVIIPFALNAVFPGLGAIYSGALGAGIGTLVQGGNLKDAFKNALIGGAIGGATAAIGGGLQAAKTPGGSFSQGAMKGIQDAAKFSNLQTAGKQLATGQFGQSGYEKVLSDQTLVTPASETLASVKEGITPESVAADATKGVDGAASAPVAAGPDQMYLGTASDALPPASPLTTPSPLQSPNPADQAFFGSGQISSAQPTPPPTMLEQLQSAGKTAMDYGGKAMDFLTGSDPTFAQKNKLALDFVKESGGKLTYDKALEMATAELTPGLIRTYGPSLALAGGATYLAGGFTPQELDEMSDEERLAALGPSGYDLYMANQAKYGLPAETPKLAQGLFSVPTTFAADGGEIFPRRVGGIMPDEGTPGKDSVKAMLMPGEFVMTTNAVKGLGDGDNNKGINRMYDMMRGLEAKGKAMA
tara:strand:+ start:3691 stop:5406 length:1716 start_codon:yes stop_codon:yes gene_type:complete